MTTQDRIDRSQEAAFSRMFNRSRKTPIAPKQEQRSTPRTQASNPPPATWRYVEKDGHPTIGESLQVGMFVRDRKTGEAAVKNYSAVVTGLGDFICPTTGLMYVDVFRWRYVERRA